MRNRTKFLAFAALVLGGTVFYYQQDTGAGFAGIETAAGGGEPTLEEVISDSYERANKAIEEATKRIEQNSTEQLEATSDTISDVEAEELGSILNNIQPVAGE